MQNHLGQRLKTKKMMWK